jgi:hypothetical protein
MRQGPPAEPLQHDAVREREHELKDIADKRRAAEESIPRRHPLRRLFAKLRRHH